MSKRSSLMEAAKQNKKKTAIIAVVVVLVLAALFMRFRGGSKGRFRRRSGGPGGMQDTQIDNVATVAAENPKKRNDRSGQPAHPVLSRHRTLSMSMRRHPAM